MDAEPIKKTAKRYQKSGRPKAEIDWNEVGQLLEAGATAEGVAASIGVQRDTLYKRCQKDNNCDFSTFAQRKKAKGEEMLRVAQFKTAMDGNPTLQIWLGKQRLGQRDRTGLEEAELRQQLYQQQIAGTVYDLERKAIVYDLPLDQVTRAYLADPRSQSVPAEIRAGVAERLLGNAQLLGEGNGPVVDHETTEDDQ